MTSSCLYIICSLAQTQRYCCNITHQTSNNSRFNMQVKVQQFKKTAVKKGDKKSNSANKKRKEKYNKKKTRERKKRDGI